MSIIISENYKIETDKNNILLLSKIKSSEKEIIEEGIDDEKVRKEWRIEGYFANLQNLFKHLVELEVKKTDLKDLETVVDKVQKCYDLINKVCPNITISELRKAKKGETKDESDDDN